MSRAAAAAVVGLVLVTGPAPAWAQPTGSPATPSQQEVAGLLDPVEVSGPAGGPIKVELAPGDGWSRLQILTPVSYLGTWSVEGTTGTFTPEEDVVGPLPGFEYTIEDADGTAWSGTAMVTVLMAGQTSESAPAGASGTSSAPPTPSAGEPGDQRQPGASSGSSSASSDSAGPTEGTRDGAGSSPTAPGTSTPSEPWTAAGSSATASGSAPVIGEVAEEGGVIDLRAEEERVAEQAPDQDAGGGLGPMGAIGIGLLVLLTLLGGILAVGRTLVRRGQG